MDTINTDIYTEENSQKQMEDTRKSKIVTRSEDKSLRFSDNLHIADLQQRLIRLEYEVLFIKDKLFEESRTNAQPKLSPYGKLVKRRLSTNG